MSATIIRQRSEPVASPQISEAGLRAALIDSQLRTNGVTEPTLLAAVEAIARSRFILGNDSTLAYTDRPVPLGTAGSHALPRAINPVLTTARLILDADIRPGQNILLIGASTGYAAAVLAALGARVTAVECDASLVAHARAALAETPNIALVEAPLPAGAPDHAPYDRLIVDGAIEALPITLTAQLRDGGRIATGLFDRGVTRLARAICGGGQDMVHPIAFADLECVRLPGFSSPTRFTF